MGIQIDVIEVVGNCLLFMLVFGMSATVDIGCMRTQLGNKRAILTGVFLQFVVLPFLGFIVVKSLNMSAAMGITLLVVTSSPGGSYSNWWCSMFNGDLALSVTMTAISTVMSVIMLPLNLLFYVRFCYDADVISSLDWVALFTSLIVVLSAIGLGLLASDRINSHNFNMHANRLGNFAGISLVVFSAVLSNSDEDSQMWEREWKFYFGVAAPCVFGLIVANIMTSLLRLIKPERVTVSIECCYQNVGIATSMALTMFEGDELSEAMGVPFYYGMVEAIVLGIYCVGAWKAGWTKAPSDVNFFTMLATSYEVLHAEKWEEENEDGVNVEVQLTSMVDRHTEEGGPEFHYISHEESVRRTALMKSGVKFSESVTAPRKTVYPNRRTPRLRKSKKEPSYSVVRLPDVAPRDEVIPESGEA